MRLRGQVIGGLVAAFLLVAPPGARATVVEPLPPPGGTGSSVGSLTYVTGLDDLAQLTRDDDVLHPRALAFARDVKIGMGIMIGGVALGALLVVGAATVFQQNECITPSVPPGFDLDVMPICQSHVNDPMWIAGMFTTVIGGLTGLMLMPSQTEWYDIINDWNARHPDRTLLVVPSHHHHHH